MDKRIYKILVVDDEKDFRDTLKMLFDYEGYETKCVSSGQEALGTLRNEQFSIVVTDMMMDGMDGLELLSQIKAQGHDELEVILATGYGSIETAVEAMKKGAFGYFIKGHDPDELLHELEKAISVIESRKKLSDIISRPQVTLKDFIGHVPRGTFEKGSIDFEKEVKCDTGNFLKPDYDYVGLLSSTGTYEDFRNSGNCSNGISNSFTDALYILRGNTEYPVSCLSSAFIERALTDNYRNEILESVEINIKYKGYIEREAKLAEKIMRLENLSIPEGFDFDKVQSLSIECRQKLKKYSPKTIAQASRISGVSPADISVLLVYFGR